MKGVCAMTRKTKAKARSRRTAKPLFILEEVVEKFPTCCLRRPHHKRDRGIVLCCYGVWKNLMQPFRLVNYLVEGRQPLVVHVFARKADGRVSVRIARRTRRQFWDMPFPVFRVAGQAYDSSLRLDRLLKRLLDGKRSKTFWLQFVKGSQVPRTRKKSK